MGVNREVAIIGVGLHPYGIYPDKTYDDLLIYAVMKALKDANVEWRDIQYASGGITPYHGVQGLVPCSIVADKLGHTGIPMNNSYTNCATGTAAFRDAHNAVGSGQCDIAMVMAADKTLGGFYPVMGGHKGKDNFDWIRFEMVGMANPAYWAMDAMRRMVEYGTTEEDFAMVKVQCSQNGYDNPNARFRKIYTLEEVRSSPIVSYPLRLFEICATSDAAAAIVLSSMDIARARTVKPITVAASTTGSSVYGDDTMRPFDLSTAVKANSGLKVSESVQAIKMAYEGSGIGPEDLDLVELPDNSSWHFFSYCEAVGLCKVGEAEKLLRSGDTAIGGKIPVCPSGGASTFGEAIPVQQLMEVHEIVQQLRGNAGRRQVMNAKVGLAQTYGGQGNSGTIILKR
jgi:acetyl-CoA acetyltransferase